MPEKRFCLKHEGFVVCFYCVNCNLIGCKKCLCDCAKGKFNISGLRDTLAQPIYNEFYNARQNKNGLQQDLDKRKTSVENTHSKLSLCYKRINEEIEARFRELQQELIKKKEDLVQECRNRFDQQLYNLSGETHVLEQGQDLLNTVQQIDLNNFDAIIDFKLRFQVLKEYHGFNDLNKLEQLSNLSFVKDPSDFGRIVDLKIGNSRTAGDSGPHFTFAIGSNPTLPLCLIKPNTTTSRTGFNFGQTTVAPNTGFNFGQTGGSGPHYHFGI